MLTWLMQVRYKRYKQYSCCCRPSMHVAMHVASCCMLRSQARLPGRQRQQPPFDDDETIFP